MNNLSVLLFKVPNETTAVRKELADYVGVNLSTIYKWEANPKIKVSYEKTDLIVKYFQQFFPCSLDDLIGRPKSNYKNKLVY